MESCYLGVAIGAAGESAVACADERITDVACKPSFVADIDATVATLARGRPARVRVEGPATEALEVALRLARLPVVEVTVLRTPARHRAEPALRRAARLVMEARRAA